MSIIVHAVRHRHGYLAMFMFCLYALGCNQGVQTQSPPKRLSEEPLERVEIPPRPPKETPMPSQLMPMSITVADIYGNSDKLRDFEGREMVLTGVAKEVCVGWNPSGQFQPMITATGANYESVYCYMSDPAPWDKVPVKSQFKLRGRYKVVSYTGFLENCVIESSIGEPLHRYSAETYVKTLLADPDALDAPLKPWRGRVIIKGKVERFIKVRRFTFPILVGAENVGLEVIVAHQCEDQFKNVRVGDEIEVVGTSLYGLSDGLIPLSDCGRIDSLGKP